MRKTFKISIIVLVLLSFGVVFLGCADDSVTTSTKTSLINDNSQGESADKKQEITYKKEDAESYNDAWSNESNDDLSDQTVTMGEKNALSKAKQYLEIMPFSYSGLIEQLEYEGFSNSEAKYAVDNCAADWNEQAANKAGEYLGIMSFSKSGLIEQLEYEGFTHEQAVYGVEANGY